MLLGASRYGRSLPSCILRGKNNNREKRTKEKGLQIIQRDKWFFAVKVGAEEGLVAGLVANLIAWRCAIYVWRQIIVSELRRAEELPAATWLMVSDGPTPPPPRLRSSSVRPFRNSSR